MISRAIVVAPSPLGVGGLGQAAEEFVAGLTAHGVQTRYVGERAPDVAVRIAASRVVRRAFGSAPHRRAEARLVRRAVPARGWDLVYAIPGTLPLDGDDGVRVLHQSGRLPAIMWEAMRRGERETGGRGDLSRLERRRMEHELSHADLVHVTTEAIRAELLAAGHPAERVVLAPLGVDLERFRPAPKPDDLRIGFVGPLSMLKGVDVVAALAERLRGRATVTTVGGPKCPWSRRIAERAAFEPHRSVPEMLARAHVLVLPSRADAFGYVVLEALASGAVPIVTPEVGAGEIVRRLDARLVIERADFVEGVLDLLPRLDLPGLAERGRRLAEGFDRRQTGPRAAAAVLEAATRLQS